MYFPSGAIGRLLFVFLLTCSSLTFATPLLESRGIPTKNALRILPLGDSITYGVGSTDGNGYRQYLLNLLSGNTALYIGTVRSGNMSNNENEGHPGAIITEISTYADKILPARPNVVLLMAGTNDVGRNVSLSTAPARLGTLIDKIVAACPDAVVLVAQVTPRSDQAKDAQTKTFNAALPAVVQQRAKAGKHVLLVDMYSALTTKDLSDGLHPNNNGYNLMAQVWFKGLQTAASNNWINAPVKV